MFIEKKDSWLFLAKKAFWKKFLVKIESENIVKENIELLTKKECEYIYDSQNYNKLSNEIYNERLLCDIIYRSKLLNNYIDIQNCIWHEIVLLNNEIIDKWTDLEWWRLYEFPRKFIFNSNNIEWSKIPEDEVEKIIKNKKFKYKVKNEITEVYNSLNAWKFLDEKFIFNEANIKKLYHILTKNLLQENWEKYPRGFKKVKNIINNSITTDPENISKEIKKLIKYYKNNKKSIFPLQIAFDFHLIYEQIHPFENGNWRTWRLIMNKILRQNWMIPMIVFSENKQSYFNAIASCKSGNNKKYYKFMLEQYKKTLDQVDIII